MPAQILIPYASHGVDPKSRADLRGRAAVSANTAIPVTVLIIIVRPSFGAAGILKTDVIVNESGRYNNPRISN